MKRHFLNYGFVFLGLCCGRDAFAQANACRQQDSLQLVAFYNATGGPNWANRTNWLTANPIDTWYGIALNADNCVSKISLSRNQLVGTIPNLNLPNLTELNVHYNQLTGSLPNFDLAPNLQILRMEVNQLTGIIPNFNLPALRRLVLSVNQFTGSMINFNLLPNLQDLYVNSNQLTGSIPNFNALPNLRDLRLDANQFTGSIPNFNLIPNLASLDLRRNQLSGTIPNFNFPNLVYLGLKLNQLTGALPNFNYPNLQELDVSNNLLSGAIPNWNLPNAQYLDIADNRFTHGHLMPNFVNSFASTKIYAPQDSIFRDTTVTQWTGANLNISLGIDEALTSSRYQWYKNGVIYGSPNTHNRLIINNLNSSNIGIYTCRVTNPNLPQLTLYSRKITLVVEQRVVSGGNITSTLCGDRDFRLPSGRIVNVVGIHADTIRHTAPTLDTAYIVQLNRDTTCHCQDSIALASMHHRSGGYPNDWNLRQPMNQWAGLTFNNNGCVTTWRDARPDTAICVQLNQNYTLYADFGIFNALSFPKRWSKNGTFMTNTDTLQINRLQRADTGRYVARMDANGQFSTLPTLQYADGRTIRLKLCCQPSQDSIYETILTGNCRLWGGINRCVSGIYRDTLRGASYTGCDSIRILNLRVVTCNVDVNIAQLGNTLYANATSSIPITRYQWSTGVTTQHIALRNSGNYSVVVTDSLGCRDTAQLNFSFDPTLNFGLDSAQVKCTGGEGSSVIRLKVPVQNATAFTVRINFDPTKVQPNVVTAHRYHFLIPNADSSFVQQLVNNGNQLVITFGVSGLRTMNGNVGDTLIQISWLSVGTLAPNTITMLSGWVEESNRNIAGQGIYTIRNQLKSVSNGALLTSLLGVPNHTTNLTKVKMGTPQQMRLIGTVGNLGNYLVNPFTGTHLQFVRQSEAVVGLPDIGGHDANLMFLMIAGSNDPRVTALTQQKVMAADVNGDGEVNGNDLSELMYRATHIVRGFQQTNVQSDVRSWRFFPKYRLASDSTYRLNYMRYTDPRGVIMYRIPAIDSIFNLDAVYYNRCDTTSLDVQAILLGDIDQNNTDTRKGKLSTAIRLKVPTASVAERLIPIYVDNAFNGIDAKFETYVANMEILGLDSIRTGLILLLNRDNIAKKSYLSGYATQGTITTTRPIAYLRVRYSIDPCWRLTDFGNVQGYLDGQGVDTRIEICTKNDDLLGQVLRIHPNPSEGIFHLESSEKLGAVRVFNSVGQLVKDLQTIENQLDIDLTKLSSGIYHIKVGDNVHKVVKQ